MKSRANLMKNFRDFWESSLSDLQQKKLRMLFDGGNLLFFFRYNNEVYGAPELSRVTFAKMKNPDDDESMGFRKEASFTATNLSKLAIGQQQTMLFVYKDLPQIGVLSKEEAMRALEEFLEEQK